MQNSFHLNGYTFHLLSQNLEPNDSRASFLLAGEGWAKEPESME